MTKKEVKEIPVPIEKLTGMIYSIRGQKVMLSTQLADLYGVEPRVLVQAVKRNIERFPKDFMFQLTQEEFANLKSQIVISSWGGMRRSAHMHLPNKVLQCSPVFFEANAQFK